MLNNPYSACTSILIGKNATVDGSVMIGRNEDSRPAWPKHFVVHPAKTTPNATFKSTDNTFEMPLPEAAAKYTATPEWSDKYGVFEEDGINEFGVAMSATESTYSNDRVLAADPLVKDGIGEEAMITVTLPYIKSAREGVARLVLSLRNTALTNQTGFSLPTAMKPGTLKPALVITGSHSVFQMMATRSLLTKWQFKPSISMIQITLCGTLKFGNS